MGFMIVVVFLNVFYNFWDNFNPVDVMGLNGPQVGKSVLTDNSLKFSLFPNGG